MNHREPELSAARVPELVTIPLCVIIFFSVLNGMMFNVVIPDIALEFDLLPSEVSWVMTGYILLFGLGSLFYGRLADQRSVRGLITLGLILLNAGSLVGFFSSSYPMLIVARLIQASGGGAIPALAMLVATKYMPPESRGKVLGIIASTVALAAGVGPILGGFVAAALNWRHLFLMTLVTILVIP
jgi:DHA2 family metal-tetracycline-proton antiporter-like MFS transporter